MRKEYVRSLLLTVDRDDQVGVTWVHRTALVPDRDFVRAHMRKRKLNAVYDKS